MEPGTNESTRDFNDNSKRLVLLFMRSFPELSQAPVALLEEQKCGREVKVEPRTGWSPDLAPGKKEFRTKHVDMHSDNGEFFVG